MKNSINKIAFVALIALALVFVACSNPAGSGAAASIATGSEVTKTLSIDYIPSSCASVYIEIIEIAGGSKIAEGRAVLHEKTDGEFIAEVSLNPWVEFGKYLIQLTWTDLDGNQFIVIDDGNDGSGTGAILSYETEILKYSDFHL